MIKRVLATVSFMLATILGSLGVAAFATDTSSVMAVSAVNHETTDVALHERVDTLLRTDVGLIGSQFRVQTRSGVITLGGKVPDEHSMRRALDLASGVHGVREVRNAMEIDSPK